MFENRGDLKLAIKCSANYTLNLKELSQSNHTNLCNSLQESSFANPLSLLVQQKLHFPFLTFNMAPFLLQLQPDIQELRSHGWTSPTSTRIRPDIIYCMIWRFENKSHIYFSLQLGRLFLLVHSNTNTIPKRST